MTPLSPPLAQDACPNRGQLDTAYCDADNDLVADTPKDAPVLVYVHGGGWTIGYKQYQGLPILNALAAAEPILESLRTHPDVIRCATAGGWRSTSKRPP